MADRNSTIPKGWKITTLGEVAEIIMGQSPNGESYNQHNNGVPFYQGITEFNDKYVGIKTYTNQPTKVVEKNTILFSVRAPVGKVNFTKHKACIGRGNAGLRMKNNQQEFLYFLLKQNERVFLNNTTGTVFDSISGVDLRSFKIVIPENESEQRVIAAVLSSLDDKIELLRKQNKTLESIAEALFREWFVEDGQLKIDSGEWKEKSLGEVTDIGIGRTPPRKEKEWFSLNSKDNKWVSIKDLGGCGAFILNTSEFLTNKAVNSFNIPVIPKDTVVLSFKMTVGRVAITGEDMLSNEAIAHFRFNANTPISKEYLYMFLKSYNYEQLGSTSTIVTSVNSRMIKDIVIPIPDKETMLKFNRIAEEIFRKIRNSQIQISTLSSLRDTFLPKLMKGEIRVKKEIYNG